MKGPEMLASFLSAAGIGFAAFAEAIGVNPSSVYNYVNGKRTPDLSVAVKIERQTCGKIPAAAWVEEVKP